MKPTTAAPPPPMAPADPATVTGPGPARTGAVSWRGLGTVAAVVLLVGGLLAAGLFWVGGGRWFVTQSPSMGTAAPVGTLILTQPAQVSDLVVGDVIAFHPPTDPAQTYTHRVVALFDGHATTRGDLNGAADPWQVTDRDLIGRAVLVAPGWGWLARALPLLVLGFAVVWGLARLWLRPDRRGPALLVGACLVIAVVVLLLRPFVGVTELTATTDAGVTQIAVVSTGLLPISIAPIPGHGQAEPVALRSGEAGTVHLTQAPADGEYALTASLDLSRIGWLIALLICALPLLCVLLIGFPPAAPTRAAAAP